MVQTVFLWIREESNALQCVAGYVKEKLESSTHTSKEDMVLCIMQGMMMEKEEQRLG